MAKLVTITLTVDADDEDEALRLVSLVIAPTGMDYTVDDVTDDDTDYEDDDEE